MKTLARYLAGALVLGVLIWVGAYLYWHVKIIGLLRSIETHAPAVGSAFVPSEYHESVDLLTESGCRSLSYLVGSLGSSKAPWEMSKYFFRILCNSQESGGRAESASYIPAARLQSECLIDPSDAPPIRQHKIDRIRAWWAEAGPDYHQWWRLWSSNCHVAR
jgi:hypothetical protein